MKNYKIKITEFIVEAKNEREAQQIAHRLIRDLDVDIRIEEI